MKSWIRLFNCFLLMGLLAVPLACRSAATKPAETKSKKKEATIFRVHLEVNSDASGRNHVVPILRSSPMLVCVDNNPLLNEGNVDKATVVESNGLFSLQILFNDQGKRILEMTTIASKGQRLAIYSEFGSARWLAAPLITRPILDGMLVFTPDASREETDRIVRGLNNVAEEMKKRNKF
jgi:hypothetical protein